MGVMIMVTMMMAERVRELVWRGWRRSQVVVVIPMQTSLYFVRILVAW